jgi:hypothetical protein
MQIVSDDFQDQIETIAKDIEQLQSAAIVQIAERLSVANDLFRYRRNGNGFVAWVETRLKFSQRTAYNLLSVHEKFGGKECLQILQTLPRMVLYLLAAPDTPDEAVAAVTERVESGEKLSVEDVKEEIAAAKPKRRGGGAKPRDNQAETNILDFKNKNGKWPTRKEGVELTGGSPRNFDNAIRAAKAFEAGQNSQEKMISIHVLIEELVPLFKRIKAQAEKHAALVSKVELLAVVSEGQRLLDRWTSDDPTVRRTRDRVIPIKRSAKRKDAPNGTSLQTG